MGPASLSLAWVAAGGAPLAVLLAVVGAGSLTSSVFKPCLNALVPQVVAGPRELIAANPTYAAIEATGTIVGPVLSGLLTVLEPQATFLALAVLFLAAGLRRRTATLSGFTVLVQPSLLPVSALFRGQTVMRGLLNVFVVVLAVQDVASDLVGSDFAAIGVGGLVGAAATGRARRRCPQRAAVHIPDQRRLSRCTPMTTVSTAARDVFNSSHAKASPLTTAGRPVAAAQQAALPSQLRAQRGRQHGPAVPGRR